VTWVDVELVAVALREAASRRGRFAGGGSETCSILHAAGLGPAALRASQDGRTASLSVTVWVEPLRV
jgi:hypothetical protein